VPREAGPIAAVAPAGQDGPVGADTLRFGVEKAKFKWGALLQDSLLGKTSVSGRYQDPVQRAAVVVHNARGDKQVLETAKTAKGARDRADTIEREFKTLDTAQWCERYDVAPSFVSV
jgi:hypothetical protein